MRKRSSTRSALLALEWREVARADLLSIVDYISDDNPDAAQRLKDEIEVKAAKLLEHPRLYRTGRVRGTREMIVRSNYIVIYAEALWQSPGRRSASRSRAGSSPHRFAASRRRRHAWSTWSCP